MNIWGSAAGLGYLIQQAEGVFDVAAVFAGMFVLSVFVILIDLVVTLVERRLLVWRPTATEGGDRVLRRHRASHRDQPVSLGRVRIETRNRCTGVVDGNEGAQRRSAFVTFDLEISAELPQPRAHSGNSNTQRDAEFGAGIGRQLEFPTVVRYRHAQSLVVKFGDYGSCPCRRGMSMYVGQRFLEDSEYGPLYFIGKMIDSSRNSDAALDSGSGGKPFAEGLYRPFQAKTIEVRRMQKIRKDAYFCLRFTQRRLDFLVSFGSSFRIAFRRLHAHEIDALPPPGAA